MRSSGKRNSRSFRRCALYFGVALIFVRRFLFRWFAWYLSETLMLFNRWCLFYFFKGGTRAWVCKSKLWNLWIFPLVMFLFAILDFFSRFHFFICSFFFSFLISFILFLFLFLFFSLFRCPFPFPFLFSFHLSLFFPSFLFVESIWLINLLS
jgi:hypothetical protein